MFFHIFMKSYDVFSLHFFIGKTYMFEHRKLTQKTCVGISEQFPIAYDGIHMKLLNVELFISNALTFSYMCFSISIFSLLSRIWALAPPSL